MRGDGGKRAVLWQYLQKYFDVTLFFYVKTTFLTRVFCRWNILQTGLKLVSIPGTESNEENDYLAEIQSHYMENNQHKPRFHERLDAAFKRLRRHARFSDMAQIALKNSWFRRNRFVIF